MKKRSNERRIDRKPNAPRGRKVTVTEQNTLLAFLFQLLNEQSKSSVKALLGFGQISINEKTVTHFDAPLEPGDVVGISYERGKGEFNNSLLKIIYEDDDLIVVNKKEGLLSVSNARVKERTAYHFLSDYVKKEDPKNKIFVLHRLDRDTSGLMMFAKSLQVQKTMQADWNTVITERSYVAVVEGRPERDTDLITSFLTENAQMRVYVAIDGEGKEAITRYRVLGSNGRYSLLDLTLETGRKNQIRAQMESIGHPIAGDAKYGAETSPVGRMMLHARKLCFIHPTTGEEMRFETRMPTVFTAVIK